MMDTFYEYQIAARRTQKHDLPYRDKLEHALYGLVSEVGEVLGCFQKVHQGHELDVEEVAKEMGDVMWFLSELADCLGLKLASIAFGNIEKLKDRYPAGFDADRSVNRDEYASKGY